MKKQLLSLGFALMSLGLMAAWPTPYTCTKDYTDTMQKAATILMTPVAPTLDGQIGDKEIWSVVAEVDMNRPFITSLNPFTPDTPTLYKAYWKACWTDTAIFVLVYVEDNNFWPQWKSKLADWQSDKVETYYGVNGIEPEGKGPANSGAEGGRYQITHNYDSAGMGTVKAGSVPGTYEANTYTWGDHAILITEWSVHHGAGAHSLWQVDAVSGDSTRWDATTDSVIKFDVGATDLDSLRSPRQRQLWSNVGRQGENWVNLDYAGHLTLSSNMLPNGINNGKVAGGFSIYPTAVKDVLYSNMNYTIYGINGQVIMNVTSRATDLSRLSSGVYIAKSGASAIKFIKQ